MVGSVQDVWTWTSYKAVCQGNQQPHPSQNRRGDRDSLQTRIVMALNMAQQVVKELYSLTLYCAGLDILCSE